MKEENLPKIIITGASGIIGRYIIEDLCEYFHIYALARRTQQEANVLVHKNVQWILVDIARQSSLTNVMQDIKNQGDVDFIIHMAAYYDFTNERHPEYERTNVEGTRLMLEHAKELNIKRFIFPSSLAACKFPAPGEAVNEHTPPDADFPYAVAKRKCEKMLREYSEHFPCTSIRLAAVFSDWCEYGPLYMFLKTWLSDSWDSRIIGGAGESAIPYVHINCVSRVISIVLEKSDQLENFDTYVVTTEGATSHQELFDLATRLYFGEIKHPVFMSKWLATIGVYLQYFLGSLIGKKPFVRPWMMKLIDLKLTAESAYTRKTLGWQPPPRLHILQRLLFLVENLKSSPFQWHQMNTAALEKRRLVDRPNLILAELMQHIQRDICTRIMRYLLSPDQAEQFKSYYELQDPNKVMWYVEVVYNLLIASVRNGDRYALVNYARSLAGIRSQEGFEVDEVCSALKATGDFIGSALLDLPETKGMELLIHDWITLAIQLAVDEVEDSFERLARMKKAETGEEVPEVCK